MPAVLEDRSAHTFHIPVMGTGFTIDTPLRVAKYGISSSISLVDDVLVEQMRRFHCEKEGEPYEEILGSEEDSRARRITAYLNLLDRLVRRQVERLRASPFEPGSEIARYYELLPESPIKETYRNMLATADPNEKARMQDGLRRCAVPGSIDVNIMTKLDCGTYRGGQELPRECSDALTALRGFANSVLCSSIVFSAGINQRLFAHAARFDDFFPDEAGALRKRIILKVSDFRSAAVQGKFLAKRGLWASEYRIESGLNCGGHAFPSAGIVMGPVLGEFKRNREELAAQLHGIYNKALNNRGRPEVKTPHEVRITVQGGIGTAAEDELLLKFYEVNGTGWGTAFLVVPEVTSIDDAHREKLVAATDRDIYLSESSPLGVPYWNLRNSGSEEARRRRVQSGKPGSSCPKGFLAFDTEFTKIPICRGSRAYQRRKLEELAQQDLSAERLLLLRENVLVKSCICHDLAGGAVIKNGIDPDATPAIACGPSIVDFMSTATLEGMVGHIYGRQSLFHGTNRPHMFIRELMISIEYLRDEIERFLKGLSARTPRYFREFKENLLDAFKNYHELSDQFVEAKRQSFIAGIETLRKELEAVPLPASAGWKASSGPTPAESGSDGSGRPGRKTNRKQAMADSLPVPAAGARESALLG